MKPALIVWLLLVPRLASADTLYGYVGEIFEFAQGAYTPGETRITGSFLLDDLFVAALDPERGIGPSIVTEGVLEYSFTDGYQTLTQDNSIGYFEVGFTFETPTQPLVPGAGRSAPYWWSFTLTGAEGSIRAIYATHEWASSISLGPQPGIQPCAEDWNRICFDDPNISAAMMVSNFGGNQWPNGGPGTWTVQSVPEPGSLALLGMGLTAAAWRRRRHLRERDRP